MIMRKDLVDISDDNYSKRQGEFLLCQECDYEFGGTQGDYWSVHMDYALHCPDCESENIALVKATRVLTVIKE